MNRLTIISVCLIAMGFLFECFHLWTDIRFFEIKFWLLGIICFFAGALGLIWNKIIPILERRAKTLGQFKGKKKQF